MGHTIYVNNKSILAHEYSEGIIIGCEDGIGITDNDQICIILWGNYTEFLPSNRILTWNCPWRTLGMSKQK